MKRLISIGVILTAVIVLLLDAPVFAQAPKKVLLMPFTLYADEDLAYLQKGIGQMLTSRLAQPDKVEVLPADPAAKDVDPVEQANSLGADYLITGSLTLLGNSVSTDAKVLDLKQNKQVVTFNRVGKDKAMIIDHVDQLADQINTELFGLSPKPSAGKPVAPKAEASAPSIYQHPEKLITQGDERDRLPGDGTAYAPQASLLMRGRRVSFQIRGITAGDVDGDGSKDVVCIGPSSIVVYGVARNQFVKKAEMKRKGGNYVAVDAVDVNNNGKAEIFVTNFYNTDSRVTSFVLEWDGKKLVRIADNLAWYYRAVEVPNRGTVLAGQRQGMDEPFANTIHEIGWQGGSYGPVQRLPLPRGLSIYGFAYGSVRSPHDTEVVAYNRGGFVRILNQRGGEEWITSERYGGSHVFIDFPNATDRSSRVYVYLSPRIHLHDMDGDGLQEIFVLDNEDIAGAFDRVRLFKNGRLEGLKWDDLGMIPKWRTRNLAKYISDFVFADVDGDGNVEVVASVVQEAGSVVTKARSFLAVFKLAKISPKTEG